MWLQEVGMILESHFAQAPLSKITISINKAQKRDFIISMKFHTEKWKYQQKIDLQNLAKMFIRVEVQINFQSSNFIHGLYFLWSCPSLK